MSDCPTSTELQRFERGELSQDDLERVATHLETCSQCAEWLDAAESDVDELMNRLRQQEETGGTDDAELINRVLDVASASIEHEPGRPLLRRPSVEDVTEISESFGDYTLLEEIARGGMGIVYRAHQISLNRIVAIKMILAGRWAGESQRRRFRMEAEAAAKLDHPGIVPVYEVDEHEGRVFFSMGFVDGPSLAEYLKSGPLPPREAAVLLRKIAAAIQYAHEHGVIHRDLKPRNVLLASVSHSPDSLVPRIADFGLAKLVTTDSDLTVSGQVIGTPGYMPPEQAAGRHDEIKPQSDIYSLGALFYHALTGRPPFQADNALETLRQVVDQEPVPPRQLNPVVDRDLETICLKCLEKDPAARFAAASEVVDELSRFAAGEPIRSRPAGQADRIWRWAKRNRVISGLLLLVALLLLCGTGVSTFFALRAQTEAVRARSEEQRANREAAVATELAEKESTARIRIEQLVGEEQFARLKAEKVAYAFQIHAAREKVRAGRITSAQTILNGCAPDARGWEHAYVKRHANRLNARFKGHAKDIHAVAFNHDGSQIATGSEDETVRLWDAHTGKELHKLEQIKCRCNALVFSRDGRHLFTGGWDGMVTQWDTQTGEKKLAFQAHDGAVFCIGLSKDGKQMVTGAYLTVRVWDASDGTMIHTITGHGDNVSSATFSPNGQLLLSCAKTGKLWDARTGTQQLSFPAANSLVFSPDGKRIAAGEQGGLIRIRNAKTGTELFTLNGHNHAVTSVAFSPDGRRIASGSWDNTVRIWDSSNGREVLNLEGHEDYVWSVAFSPDGKRVVSSSRDRTAIIWSVETQEGRPCGPSSDRVQCVTFSHDDTEIVSAGYDRVVRVRDARTGAIKRELKGHAGRVQQLVVTCDDERIVSASIDGTVRIWDPATGATTRILRHPHCVNAVAASPHGEQIVTGCADKIVRVWNVATGAADFVMEGHGTELTCVAWSLDGTQIASGSSDGNVRIWDAKTGRALRQFMHFQSLASLSFSPDGTRLVCGAARHNEGVIKVWDVQTTEAVVTVEGWMPFALAVCFTPDGKRIVGNSERHVKVWDAATGEQLENYSGHTWVVNAVALTSDGKRIGSCSGRAGIYGELRVWNRETGKAQVMQEHTTQVNSLAVSPDGHLVASGEQNGNVSLLDVRSGAVLCRLQGHTKAVSSVAWNNAGTQLVSTSLDKKSRLWDVVPEVVESANDAAMQEAQTVTPSTKLSLEISTIHTDHDAEVLCAAFSPSGQYIATSGADNCIRIKNAGRGTEKCTLRGHMESVTSCTFHPDHPWIVSGSRDRTVKLWNIETGSEIRTFSGHTDAVSCVVFSPDGERCASAGNDHMIRLWNVVTGEIVAMSAGHSAPVTTVAFSPDGTRFVTGSLDKTVRVWDSITGVEVLNFSGPSIVLTVAFSCDGNRIVCGRGNPADDRFGDVFVWEASTNVVANSQNEND